MRLTGLVPGKTWEIKRLLLYKRWPWHILFWMGYIIFQFWLYYITVKYYAPVYLEYMLFSDMMFVATTYFTIWLYRRFFQNGKYLIYFTAGAVTWAMYLYGRTVFQFYYLQNAPGFQGNSFTDIFLNNIAIVILSFLYITSCKYFKDGYILQQFEKEKKEQQLIAEVNNLKSQIAPHFLFNTLNNLYGLAVDKSDKLPGLMLRLSDLLRHSLYETQKSQVPLHEEIAILKSYIELESIRLENNLKMQFDDTVGKDCKLSIAPLILIVFMENAFKHAKFVENVAVNIYISTKLEEDWFTFIVKNNYNYERGDSGNGIGLTNVKRRLEVLYPDEKHDLAIVKDEIFYTVTLRLQLLNII